jgi:hypothetical protein
MSFFKKICLYSGFCFFSVANILCADGSPNSSNNDIENAYGYGKFSLGSNSAMSMDVGYRYQAGYHGIEGGIGITSLYEITEAHLFTHYIFFPLPSTGSQFYLGFGIQGGIAHDRIESEIYRYLSPQLFLGKEFASEGKSRKFIQINADIDSLKNIKNFEYSSISVSAGFCF